jgi:oxygen-independent coproporphyrinogen-3 oxidase
MLSLYFHIPFCNHKCFYCDFYSLGKFSSNQEDSFIESLLKEIDISSKKYYKGEEIDTIFFGGGTPSVLTKENFEKISTKIKDVFNLSNNIEWTVECNPESITNEKLNTYLEKGVNRLSIGAQSFNSDELVFLERIHKEGEISDKFNLARDAGFKNINIDLIFSLPNQKKEVWLNTLNSVFDFNPEHISAYSLIFEEKTKLFKKFEKGIIKPNQPEFEQELYLETIELMNNNGYLQYEVSNFAKEGFDCRHNLNYWYGINYLSFGPSAHSYIGNNRFWNFRNLNKYNSLLANDIIPVESEEILNEYNKISECIYLNLRAKGINIIEFQNRFKLDILNLLKTKLPFLLDEFIIFENNFLKLNKKGYSMADEVALKIIEKIN